MVALSSRNKQLQMIRTFFFFFTLWLSLFLSVVFLIPVIILLFTARLKTKTKYLQILISGWSKMILFIAGVKVNRLVHPDFPLPSGYIIVSNHQGYFDVPLILSVFPEMPAFISKIELKRIPFLNIWMNAMDCLFIDRSDSGGSRKRIWQRLHEKNRNPLLLFPEGTRSKGKELLPFRTGGLKMVYDSGTDVVPVRISGTYRLWEEKRRIIAGTVKIEILPVIKGVDYKKIKFTEFIMDIRKSLRTTDTIITKNT